MTSGLSRPSFNRPWADHGLANRGARIVRLQGFVPLPRRQRDHAVEQDQAERVELFEGLIKDIDGAT